MDGAALRQLILEVVRSHASGNASSQQGPVLDEIARTIQKRGESVPSEAVLTFFYDLFRLGYLSWGMNYSNPNPPFFHLTEIGRTASKHLSRDPVNPEGYLEDLNSRAKLSPESNSYVEEAVRAYNAACPKAAAVLAGVASEISILEFRDTILKTGASTPDLVDWRVKRVLTGIETYLDSQKKQMDRELLERYEAHFSSLTGQLRILRNAAGHALRIDALSEESVHAALLILPESLALLRELDTWLRRTYSIT